MNTAQSGLPGDNADAPSLRDVADLTPPALERVLRPHFPTVRIREISATPVDEETGFNAQLWRVHLSYADAAPDFPRTLIAKLPTLNTALQERTAVFQPGIKEITFYRHLAARTPVHTPRCFYSALDRSGASVLLLEDLAHARGGYQLAVAAPHVARHALASLARHHAAWWGRADVTAQWGDNTTNVPAPPDDAGANLVQELFHEAWPTFAAIYGGVIPDHVQHFGAYLCDHLAAMERLPDDVPRTLTHGDFRLDNLFFANAASGELTCWVIDWEDIDFSSGLYDVAWFISTGVELNGADGEQDERALLQGYHRALTDAGVTSYSFDQCMADYRRAMLSAFTQGVLMAVTRRDETGGATATADATARRAIDACRRLRLHELTPG